MTLTTGINDIQRIGALDRNSICLHAAEPRTLHESLPIPLTATLVGLVPTQLVTLPDDDPARLEATCFDSGLHEWSVSDGSFGPLNSTRGGHDRFWACCLNALRESLRRKAAKHGRMDCAQSSDS